MKSVPVARMILEFDRLWLDEHVGYSVEYRVWGDLAELVVVRLSDRQVAGRMPASRTILASYTPKELEVLYMSFLKRVATADAKAVSATSKDGLKFAERLSAVVEYLSANKWPDGTERVTGTLTFFCDDGTFKVVLNDRDAGRSLWASGGSILDALDALESMLRAGEGEWRSTGGPKPAKRHKRS